MNHLFTPDIVAAAKLSERDCGFPACITLAQYALESDYGGRVTGDYNYWGMKWEEGIPFPYKMCATQDKVNGKIVADEAPFISFPDAATSFAYHGRAVMNPTGPYKHAIPFARKNWRTFLHMIAPIYAGDPHYEQKILELIHQYKLDAYN